MSKTQEIDCSEDDEDDEPMWWDVVAERYGRPLTEAEWRAEIKISYEDEFIEISEAEILEDLQRQKDWLVLKAEIAARERQEFEEGEDLKRAKAVLVDLETEICCCPLDENDELDLEAVPAWKERVNEIIRTRVNFEVLIELIKSTSKDTLRLGARTKAMKRHTENHAMKVDVFTWLDANMSSYRSMDAAAGAIAGKVAPIVFRTARDWISEWKKERSAGTP